MLCVGLPSRLPVVLDVRLLSPVLLPVPVLLAQVWLEGPQEPLVPCERPASTSAMLLNALLPCRAALPVGMPFFRIRYEVPDGVLM